MKTASGTDIAARRIGRGTSYTVVGGLLLAVGLFAVLAASVGGEGAAAVAALCLPLGSGLIFVGFVVGLANRIEHRLFDIELHLKGGPAARDSTAVPVADFGADGRLDDHSMGPLEEAVTRKLWPAPPA